MNADFQSEVKRAVEVLRRGGVIIYPTDTVWGIGCDATLVDAVERIYRIKGSVNKKGMIVLLDCADNICRYIRHVPDVAWDLIELSDKPLTLILPDAVGVAANLVPEEGTLAIRVAKHEFCQRVVAMLGHPLVSTSANFSGDATPSTFDQIDTQLLSQVDYVAPLDVEGTPTCTASSIVMLGADSQIKIIRQ